MMPADEQWRAGIVDDNRRYYNANLSKGMLSLRISLAQLRMEYLNSLNTQALSH